MILPSTTISLVCGFMNKKYIAPFGQDAALPLRIFFSKQLLALESINMSFTISTLISQGGLKLSRQRQKWRPKEEGNVLKEIPHRLPLVHS